MEKITLKERTVFLQIFRNVKKNLLNKMYTRGTRNVLLRNDMEKEVISLGSVHAIAI